MEAERGERRESEEHAEERGRSRFLREDGCEEREKKKVIKKNNNCLLEETDNKIKYLSFTTYLR